MIVVLLKNNEVCRIIYDRVWNIRKYFEITAILPIEGGISRVQNKFSLSYSTLIYITLDMYINITIIYAITPSIYLSLPLIKQIDDSQ